MSDDVVLDHSASNAGRKTLYSEELAQEVLNGITMGLTYKDAARSAGVSEDTLARWSKGISGAPADFADRLARARARRARIWLGGIRQAATGVKVKDAQGNEYYAVDPDWRAFGDLLDRCEPDYRKSSRVEVSHAEPAPPPNEAYNYDNLSPEEQYALAKLLEQVTLSEVDEE